jgi:hypothetical protein
MAVSEELDRLDEGGASPLDTFEGNEKRTAREG